MNKGLVMGIIAIVLIIGFVAIYGALAKNVQISQTGGGGTQETHGGVLTFLTNWFNNVSLSLVGK